MSSGTTSSSNGGSKSSKRSFGEALDEVFTLITKDQMDLLQGVATVDFNQDRTGWSLKTTRFHGLVELVDVGQLGLGRPFMAPTEAPQDGEFSFEFFANTPWVVFVLEQDLSAVGHGMLVKIVGSMDKSATVFPSSGGLVIKQPVTKFLVAKLGAGNIQTTLQGEISRMIAEQGLGASPGLAGGGGASTVASGASPPVKKAAFTSINDINLDERMVANKEGAATKVRTVAALIREMHIGRLEYLCPDWEFNVDAVRERLQCQSERPMICGDEMFSLGRMMRLELLTVWKDKTKFEGWFLGRLPSACYSLSLWDFKGPESSGWGMDTSYLGRANLLEALENFDAFLGILKGDAFKRCMDPIRDLWMEPGSLVHQYHAVFLQFHLEKMIRDYYQDITMSTGKAARLMTGYALKGQTESVALLRANVDNFVTLIRSKTLEGAPHTAFYGDNKWVRITNKPAYPTSPGRSSGQGAGGGGSASGAGVRESCHREGLCIWALADMLGLQNKTGGRYVCRPVGSEPPVTHTPLNRVRRSAIVKLLEDPKFLNGARDGLKKAILTKMEAEPKLFRRE